MKKTLVSLATASLIVTSAFAADKGIDIVTTGQAVVYYETHDDDGATAGVDESELFKGSAHANEVQFAVQLGLEADLGNNFTFGSELQYKGTAGLDMIGTDRQATTATKGATSDIADEIGLSQINITKKVGATTVKVGRQQLPKSLSPFAYTEGWNVLKNSFDAALIINKDLPDTTIVAASVGASNDVAPHNTTEYDGLHVGSRVGANASGLFYSGPIYMLTVQNKSLPMTTLTVSHYDLKDIDDGTTVLGNANVIWADAAIGGKDLPMGLKVGVQTGTISTDITGVNDTGALGVKVAAKPMKDLMVQVAYSSVDDGDVSVTNAGTGVKSPLYTQMIYNQLNIALDADTTVVKGVYNMGDSGKIIAQYGMTTAGTNNLEQSDYTELDVMYKLKSGGVQYFAALIMRNWDVASASAAGGGDHLLTQLGTTKDNRIRLWARYNF